MAVSYCCTNEYNIYSASYTKELATKSQPERRNESNFQLLKRYLQVNVHDWQV